MDQGVDDDFVASVIPAQAGIQYPRRASLGSRLRGKDDTLRVF